MDRAARVTQDVRVMAKVSVSSLRASPACRLAARLTLLLFALRAAVPAGYMPDLGALQEGEVQIVICTGSGIQTLMVNAAGQPVENGSDASKHAAAGDCAFGMAAGKAFVLPAFIAATTDHGSARRLPPPVSIAALAPPAQGPPLGSRAPPVLLG